MSMMSIRTPSTGAGSDLRLVEEQLLARSGGRAGRASRRQRRCVFELVAEEAAARRPYPVFAALCRAWRHTVSGRRAGAAGGGAVLSEVRHRRRPDRGSASRLAMAGEKLSLVVGDPAYYGRFGYDMSAPRYSKATISARRCRRWPGPRRRKEDSWSMPRLRSPLKAMPRYRLDIEYDGTPYAGWQRQAGQHSVQAAIEQAIMGFSRRGRDHPRRRPHRCRRACAGPGRTCRPRQGLARRYGARCRQRASADGGRDGQRARGDGGRRRFRRALFRDGAALSLPHPQPPRAAGAGCEQGLVGRPSRSMPRPCTARRRRLSAGTISPPSAPSIARRKARSRRSTGSMSRGSAMPSRSAPRRGPSCTTRSARWSAR